ncbi:hypothetical protein RirG_218170 [Rhizophagus irregularis DAOM 197198w]|uniref:Uncharacterized protein n=1 Tax=Rhizophagus irregularis (strain DAOM 197198w) TaxID=1432141 RepID=A0A015LN69_RHIIW|nr:hypothetical protein RirG_218170 [Rhizophagus irregularis DAOM 197198w]
MATLPKSPQENQFTVADIPKDNILEIKEIIKNPIFNEYYIKIKELITEYRKDTIYHILIPSLLAISHHALINEGFLNNKHEINYKIKFNGKTKSYNYIIGNSSKENKVKPKDNFA